MVEKKKKGLKNKNGLADRWNFNTRSGGRGVEIRGGVKNMSGERSRREEEEREGGEKKGIQDDRKEGGRGRRNKEQALVI